MHIPLLNGKKSFKVKEMRTQMNMTSSNKHKKTYKETYSKLMNLKKSSHAQFRT